MAYGLGLYAMIWYYPLWYLSSLIYPLSFLARSKKLVMNGLKIVKKEVLKGTKG